MNFDDFQTNTQTIIVTLIVMKLDDNSNQQNQAQWMRTIMTTSFLKLENFKNNYEILLLQNIKKLQSFVQFMRQKAYLDFHSDNPENKIYKQQAAELVGSELQKISIFSHLIVDKKDQKGEIYPYDYALLKLRSSPFENGLYFKCFHDLQCLNAIKPDPDKQTIEYAIKQVRTTIFKEPIRQLVIYQAKKQFQKFQSQLKNPETSIQKKYKLLYTKLPNESEQVDAETLQNTIYDLDDLNIDFSGNHSDEQKNKQTKEIELIRQYNNKGKSSFEKFEELQNLLNSDLNAE